MAVRVPRRRNTPSHPTQTGRPQPKTPRPRQIPHTHAQLSVQTCGPELDEGSEPSKLARERLRLEGGEEFVDLSQGSLHRCAQSARGTKTDSKGALGSDLGRGNADRTQTLDVDVVLSGRGVRCLSQLLPARQCPQVLKYERRVCRAWPEAGPDQVRRIDEPRRVEASLSGSIWIEQGRTADVLGTTAGHGNSAMVRGRCC